MPWRWFGLILVDMRQAEVIDLIDDAAIARYIEFVDRRRVSLRPLLDLDQSRGHERKHVRTYIDARTSFRSFTSTR